MPHLKIYISIGIKIYFYWWCQYDMYQLSCQHTIYDLKNENSFFEF